MAVLLALLSALAYGSGDFCAGLASRRSAPALVSALVAALELLAASVVVACFAAHGPTARELWWGTVSGVGSAAGTMALYAGLARGQMAVTATLSAVLAAVVPAIVGIVLGDRLTPGACAGIVIAVPAIALVSWHSSAPDPEAIRAGVGYGIMAGFAFALLFIALDRAGTRAGAWPLVPGQALAVTLVAPFAWRQSNAAGRLSARAVQLAAAAGVLGGVANVLFLAATGHGQLAIVAVLTSLYPAFTIVLARALLRERWSRVQGAGLIAAAAAIVLVSIS